MDWIIALSIFATGSVGALIHFYVTTMAKKEADIAVEKHISNCSVCKELKIFISIVEGLHEDVREIRDALLKKD